MAANNFQYIGSSSDLTSGSGLTPTLTVGISVSDTTFDIESDTWIEPIVTFEFVWRDENGAIVGVQDFTIEDLIGSPGGEIFNFRVVNEGHYAVSVRFVEQIESFTITVQANAAWKTSDTIVFGPASPASSELSVDTRIIPIVNIIVPETRPITERPIPLIFEWVYSDGEPVQVDDFDNSSMKMETTVGTIGTLTRGAGTESHRWSADLTIPDPTPETEVVVTVFQQAGRIENRVPEVRGPLEDTTKTFSIAPPTITATVTGADMTCVFSKSIVDNDVLNGVIEYLGSNAGGAFAGSLESVSIGNYHYGVVPVRKFTQSVDEDGMLVTPTTPTDFLSNMQAGAILLRVNTTNCQWEVLKEWSDVTLAARSLEVHGTDLYWLEGSHYMYDPENMFSDRDWRQKVGYVFKLSHPGTTIEELGVNRKSATTTDNPDTETTDYYYGIHGATASPIIATTHANTTDVILDMITGYGDLKEINEITKEVPVERIDNWNWMQRGIDLNQRLSVVLTNERSYYDVLKDIALMTDSILGLKNDTFFMRPRNPQKAQLESDIVDTTTTIPLEELEWGSYPGTGWLLINDELIEHSNFDGMTESYSSVRRGIQDTITTMHGEGAEVLFVNHILSLTQDTLQMPLNKVNVNTDKRQLYNQVEIMYAGGSKRAYAEDKNSMSMHPTKKLSITLPFGSGQKAWADWLANRMLQRHKRPRHIINLVLKSSFYFDVLDVVYLRVPARMHINGLACQVLEAKQSFSAKNTRVRLVTL